MKWVVWSLFFLSIIGMGTSALLASHAIREAILALWVRTADRAEAAQGLCMPFELMQAIFKFTYLRTDGQVSKFKVALLAFLHACALLTFMYSNSNRLVGKPLWEAATMVLLAFPSHFAFEYVQAKLLGRAFAKHDPSNPRLLQRRLIGSASVFLVTAAVVSFLALLATEHAPPEYRDLGILIGILIMPFLTPMLGIDLVVRGYGLDLLSHGAYLVPFMLTYMGGLLVLGGSVAIARSRQVLRSLSFLLEKVSATTSQYLFNASMFVFTVSTGVMQAWGF